MARFALLLASFLMVQPAVAADERPTRAFVVDIAQHFVQEYFRHSDKGPYRIEFDVAELHPQPDPDYWAVVGGFISDQNTPNFFVAAVRLVCSDFKKVACWSLEKLAINRDIVLDKGNPL